MLVVYLAVLSGQRAIDGYRARQQVVAAVQEITTLQHQNLALQAELNSALHESEIGRIARNELGLIRPGDRPIVLIWPDGIPPTPARNAPSTPAEPRWRDWLGLFFDLS